MKKTATDLREFDRGAKGACELFVLRNSDPRLVLGILTGDPTTLRLASCAAKFFRTLDNAKRGNAPLCLACDDCFQPGARPPAVLVTAPWGTNWVAEDSMMLVTGICARCERSKSDEQLCDVAARLMGGTSAQPGNG